MGNPSTDIKKSVDELFKPFDSPVDKPKMSMSLNNCSKTHLICLLVVMFLLLLYFNGSLNDISQSKYAKNFKNNINRIKKAFTCEEDYIVRLYDAPPNSTVFEHYGMPQVSCDQMNNIRKASKLPNLNCADYRPQQYESDE